MKKTLFWLAAMALVAAIAAPTTSAAATTSLPVIRMCASV